eukprot:CAMPEP_0119338002 /NCGR_PEP_ID=MMETSP1333-20130426/95157_1 /TAXON_ID=418940 /ORGANISM="Scyphosphaera apsteinii, Strain RCC1455" /LENGTH=172 /DNA_ID=CAMNT_0007349177 /DNA_START=253 /DNA_END=771 /DNA_ORIENTATION=+
MQQDGPHHTVTPRDVVEFVITETCKGNLSQAFKFTAIPVMKQGCHKSSTDWTQRMSWEKSRVISGVPSGPFNDYAGFESMVRSRYSALLDTEGFRFVGDDSSWQSKNGLEKETAVKEYVVELKTEKEAHYLIKFKLVYDWLVFCHLVVSVSVLSADPSRFFPGTGEQPDMDI